MDEQRQKKITASAGLRSGDLIAKYSCWWWLRSPGNNSNNAADVNNDGSVNDNGNNVNNDNNAVRPASLPTARNPTVSTEVCARGQRNRIPSRFHRENTCRQKELTLLAFAPFGERGDCARSLLTLPMFFMFEKIYDFQNLYKAHKAARLGKRGTREVIEFELDLSGNLSRLSASLRDHSYRLSGYYSFYVYDPKVRKIHALHYVDRVVQHCICDEILAPVLDKKLIYDNAACRIGKGTHFALGRVRVFLHDYYKHHGSDGYFLKCDIRKFFDSIDHAMLKEKLRKELEDPELLALLDHIVDSYETSPSKGIPLGNQTSQWFAIFYLDGLDRLIKEKLRIRYYSRYMDDCVLIHNDKQYLSECLRTMKEYIEGIGLEFNTKTQVYPIRNGVDYLGWHLHLTETGKIVQKLKRRTKRRYKQKLRSMQEAYRNGSMELENIKQVLSGYHAYLAYGHTYRLQQETLGKFVLVRGGDGKQCKA